MGRTVAMVIMARSRVVMKMTNMEHYEDTQAGADSKKSRKMGTADGKNEHASEKKNMVAGKMVHKMTRQGGQIVSHLGKKK